MLFRSGDAAKALRKVMENRRRSASGITSMPPSSNVSTIRISSSHRNGGQDRDRHNRRQSYAASATYSASTPSTVTDFDGDLEMLGAATSSTVESQGTRCVCHRKEKMDDEFMIQWYVSFLLLKATIHPAPLPLRSDPLLVSHASTGNTAHASG